MAYILTRDGRSDDAVGAFRRYREYLKGVGDRFPPSAYTLATSDWYFDFNDHRCPHDSWLVALDLLEVGSGDRQERRALSMKVRLLGAYHGSHIELHYPRVISYALTMHDGAGGHRDWRYDELRISERGNLIHEIEWSGATGTGVWVIEASDLEFQWVPS